jgi:hypothetical protein
MKNIINVIWTLLFLQLTFSVKSQVKNEQCNDYPTNSENVNISISKAAMTMYLNKKIVVNYFAQFTHNEKEAILQQASNNPSILLSSSHFNIQNLNDDWEMIKNNLMNARIELTKTNPSLDSIAINEVLINVVSCKFRQINDSIYNVRDENDTQRAADCITECNIKFKDCDKWADINYVGCLTIGAVGSFFSAGVAGGLAIIGCGIKLGIDEFKCKGDEDTCIKLCKDKPKN